MGLDMYLYLRKSKWEGKEAEYPQYLRNFVEGEDRTVSRGSITTDVYYKVGYWRKDNAIHNWFVKYCAEGIDNCQEIYVSEEMAEELLERCEKVLQDHSQAQDLLPTCDGFFFGGTQYDDWYFDGVRYTRDLLKRVLSFVLEESKDTGEIFDIVYRASW